MRPLTVSIDVPQRRDDVYAFLDVMANHERFNDHMLVDWEYSGPHRGVGAKARVHTRTGKTDAIDIEVVSAAPPRQIVEHNVGAGGRRQASGTYVLDALPSGGTRIAFEYAWRTAPRSERLLAPVVRAVMFSGLRKAMRRLAGQLDELGAARAAA